MTEENYKKALEDARAEMQRLLTDRESIDKRLTQLKSTIAALTGLLSLALPEEAEDAETAIHMPDFGITNAIRHVLCAEATRWFLPGQIKTKLEEGGFGLIKYRNPSAVIHNTLKRLAAQQEVATTKTPAGDLVYSITQKGRGEEIAFKLLEIESQFGRKPTR